MILRILVAHRANIHPYWRNFPDTAQRFTYADTSVSSEIPDIQAYGKFIPATAQNTSSLESLVTKEMF